MKEIGKGEGGGQRPSGMNLNAQLFMHSGQRGALLASRACRGSGRSAIPPRAWYQGTRAPGGRGEEGCAHLRRSRPTRLRTQGSPGGRHTLRSPRLRERGRGGWSRARSRPPEPPPQPRPPPPAPAVSGPLQQSLTPGLRGLGRGGGGDPSLGHDPKRVPQGCPTARANLSVCGRRLLLWGWGSAGPGPPLPPPPPPLPAATAAAASPSLQGRRPGGSTASTFPAPLPPPLPTPPPAPPAAAARLANSLSWVHRGPASATHGTNPIPGRLLW